jgi:hypothetical protein
MATKQNCLLKLIVVFHPIQRCSCKGDTDNQFFFRLETALHYAKRKTSIPGKGAADVGFLFGKTETAVNS